jgi:hypothetical protein
MNQLSEGILRRSLPPKMLYRTPSSGVRDRQLPARLGRASISGQGSPGTEVLSTPLSTMDPGCIGTPPTLFFERRMLCPPWTFWRRLLTPVIVSATSPVAFARLGRNPLCHTVSSKLYRRPTDTRSLRRYQSSWSETTPVACTDLNTIGQS